MDLSEKSNISKWFQFNDDKVKKEFAESTQRFAKKRLAYLEGYSDWFDPDFKIQVNPIIDEYVQEYPLPIGFGAIYEWFLLEKFDEQLEMFLPFPLVESIGAYAGLAFEVKKYPTVGWFIGVLEPYDYFNMSDNERINLTDAQKKYWMKNRHFRFIDGMILLEGQLDDLVIIQLKEFEKIYNKNILGKVVTGRPFSNLTDSYIEAARKAIKEHPLDKQLMIANEIGIAERTLQFHIKRSKYKNWEGLRDSVLNND